MKGVFSSTLIMSLCLSISSVQAGNPCEDIVFKKLGEAGLKSDKGMPNSSLYTEKNEIDELSKRLENIEEQYWRNRREQLGDETIFRADNIPPELQKKRDEFLGSSYAQRHFKDRSRLINQIHKDSDLVQMHFAPEKVVVDTIESYETLDGNEAKVYYRDGKIISASFLTNTRKDKDTEDITINVGQREMINFSEDCTQIKSVQVNPNFAFSIGGQFLDEVVDKNTCEDLNKAEASDLVVKACTEFGGNFIRPHEEKRAPAQNDNKDTKSISAE